MKVEFQVQGSICFKIMRRSCGHQLMRHAWIPATRKSATGQDQVAEVQVEALIVVGLLEFTRSPVHLDLLCTVPTSHLYQVWLVSIWNQTMLLGILALQVKTRNTCGP